MILKRILFLVLVLSFAAPVCSADDPVEFNAYQQRLKLRRASALQQRAKTSVNRPPAIYFTPNYKIYRIGPQWNFGTSEGDRYHYRDGPRGDISKFGMQPPGFVPVGTKLWRY